MRVLILGRSGVLYSTARHLIDDSPHRVVAVITATSAPEYSRKEDDFRRLADRCGARFLLTRKIDSEVLGLVRRSGAEVAVSANWVSTIHRELIESLPHGILNVHFGDLPRYRGNAVVNWAMLRGERDLVLTVHRMLPSELDAGDILAQVKMPLTSESTITDVISFAEANAPAMFKRVLSDMENGILKSKAQSRTGRRPFRCFPRLPRDGKIDWSMTARSIHALVRSLARPYPGAYTYYRDRKDELHKLYIWESRLVQEASRDVAIPGHIVKNDPASGESWVYTGEGIVALRKVSHEADGEPFMPGSAWKSIRMRLGMDLEAEIYRISRSRRGR